jgi:hypothetical protein
VDGVNQGTFAEGTKLNISAPATNAGKDFLKWTNGEDYIADSTANNTTVSVPGRNLTLTSVYDNSTIVNKLTDIPFKFYPNPSNSFIMLETGTNTELPISISDLTGKIVLLETLKVRKSINISALSKGIYIISIGKSKQKLIVN